MKHLILSFTIIYSFAVRISAGNYSDTNLIKTHLKTITKTEGFRNHLNTQLLNKTADYIFQYFSQFADTAYFQEYVANNLTYKNVVCSFGPHDARTIVLGAHYDVCEDQEGADDNASGLVGLLEIARMLKDEKLDYRIELVAYSLEEQPYFETTLMGSYIHAKSLLDEKRKVYGMISLEMIGYFDDRKNSQSYPVGFLKRIYGSRGNYITVVRKFGGGTFARKFSRKLKKKRTIKTVKFTGPAIMEGIDYSDHRNYWIFGYSAVMITDTSFFRNKNYHTKTDTMETIDIKRMAAVIDGVFNTLTTLN